MDKTTLRNFAIESRKDLMEKIDRKIKLFYVDEEFKKDNRGDVIVLSNDKHTLTLTKEEDSNRDKLIKRIVELGYEQVVEEAAYTWFNRIIAIRYMELHDFLPLTKDNQSLGIKVFTSSDGDLNPEILKFSNLSNPNLDLNIDKSYYSSLSLEDDKFKYILLQICKKLGTVIPQVFGGLTDYIDILIPDNMLKENGFISNLINNINNNNFDKVEIIGWLYQYYNQEEKDRVISSKKAKNKNEIAYATQLFTPDWIVKYMVENSLLKYYVENSGNRNILSDYKYILDDFDTSKNNFNVEELLFIDPCCGSGHILVYAFEVLYNIYVSEGYNKRDIAELILKNNLYGLDVDDRAGQLSILSVLLKAREYDKNIFNKKIAQDLNIISIQESNHLDEYSIENLPSNIKEKAIKLKELYFNAKENGSLITTDEDFDELCSYLDLENNLENLLIRDQIKAINKQNNILRKKYDIVVTNPPYMNSSAMSDNLKNYVQDHFSSFKSDLFSAFIVRNSFFGKERSYLGFMTPYVWMFISSYESLRDYILSNLTISSLIQLEYSALSEAIVPLCTFVLKNDKNDIAGKYVRLTEFTGGMEVQEKKYLEFIKDRNPKYYFTKDKKSFECISGKPIAFWLSSNYLSTFSFDKIKDYIDPRIGLVSGDNNRFLRLWNEVDYNNIGFNCKSIKESIDSKKKWFPYQKGGDYRKWYGNNEYVVNWENDGYEMKYKNEKDGRVRSHNYNGDLSFCEGISWSSVTSGNFSCRYVPYGFLFDAAGPLCKVLDLDNLYEILGFLSTNLVNDYLKVLNPTINMHPGYLQQLPFNKEIIDKQKQHIEELVKECITISKNDWDNYETSWDFKIHPLLRFRNSDNNYIKDLYNIWDNYCTDNYKLLETKEEELNIIFNDIYGLKNEVSSKPISISLNLANRDRDIKSLISYAVGCIFGRYSLDEDGLILAGGKYDKNRYSKLVPDEDNIVPISDNESIYYNDDIVGKFKDFIKNSFGVDTLNDNLDYIAETLGKRGTESSEETIRRYFVNDFYNDHVKMYQKRPIYWLFDSGKKNGFKCLVYLHRYNEQIVSKIRTKYLHNTLSIYQRTVEEIDYKLNNEELSTTDKRELQNKKSDLNSKITECNEYEEMVGNVANKMIKLDLDDGVAVNYSKFVDDNGKSILAKIK